MSLIFDVEHARFVRAGKIAPNPLWRLAAHAHPYWEFIYFIRGGGRIDLPGMELHPQQYSLAIYPPGLPHAEASDPQDPEETVYFSVDMPARPPIGAHLLLPDRNGELRWLIQRIFEESQHTTDSRLANLYMQAFLILVERMWTTGIAVPHDAIDFAVQFIHENYHRPLTLSALAATAKISATTLSHAFRRRMGISPLQYVQHLRLEEAKRLLRATDMPIYKIAEQVGFGDALYFSRLVRRATGTSPTTYRRYSK